MTEEQRERLSIANSNPSPETRAKLSAALTGCVRSPETRAKISVARMGQHMSDETRAKISVAQWRGGSSVWRRKQKAKRRTLGFHPLNNPFLGCDAHHINPDDVIHMPHKLHHSIYHNQYTGQGMVEMNALAGQYLTEDWT